jgi:UDP-N-acetylglucosamine 4,6-dehydratase/5-epimerase
MPLSAAVDLVLYAADQMKGGEIFVPKIPSSTVTQIAAMVAPGCPTVETGLRPGEKLHETLISADEASQTGVNTFPDGRQVFIIAPVNPSWPYWSERIFQPVDDSFAYRSDSPEALAMLLPRELTEVA